MLSRKEKIELLRGIAAGTRSIEELTAKLAPLSGRLIYQSKQLIYCPEQRREITREELQEIQHTAERKSQVVIVCLCTQASPITKSELATWSAAEVVKRMVGTLPDCEEDVDPTPWTPADHWQPYP